MKLNLTANTPAEEKILQYLQDNASEILANKINNGTPFEEDGQQLINKKTLSGFMKYACDEARKLAEKGTSSACVEDTVVYGWVIHYFEEESIKEKIYTVDGVEYKPPVQTKNIQKSTYTPTYKVKQENKQESLFDMLSQENDLKSDTDRSLEKDLQKSDESIMDENSSAVTQNNEIKSQCSESPVYTAYYDLKKKYPDCVVACRLGDFYEILGKDAVTIATELGLTLTSRDCGFEKRIPLVGFPYHAADNYIAKIIERGHKIAVSERLGDAKVLQGKKFHAAVDEETGEVLSYEEMKNFDGDVEEPGNVTNSVAAPDDENDNALEEEKAFAKAFDPEAVCDLSDLLGDCFILA